MLETPSIRWYSFAGTPRCEAWRRAVKIHPVRTISRKGWIPNASRIEGTLHEWSGPRRRVHDREYPESSETICRTLSGEHGAVKIWSDLHGDMQSQADMTWPTKQRTAAPR